MQRVFILSISITHVVKGCTFHNATNSPVVVHECDNVISTSLKVQKLQVLENKVFGKIFSPKKEEVSTHF
jgi:hypothetical protein